MRALDLTIEQSWRRGGPAAYGSYAIGKRLQTLFKYVSLRGQRVLDLGCGNGCYTKEMAQHARSVVGVDVEFARAGIDVVQDRCLMVELQNIGK